MGRGKTIPREVGSKQRPKPNRNGFSWKGRKTLPNVARQATCRLK